MGSDYTLTISEWESSIDVILEPDNPGEIIGEGDLKYMNVYCPSFFNLVDGVWTKDGMYISNANGNIGFDENGDPIIVTSENVKDYVAVLMSHIDIEPIFTYSDEALQAYFSL